MEPAGYGIIAPGILGFYVGRAYDDFGADCFEDVGLFFGLFVRGGENAFIAFDDGSECQAHAGIAGCAFYDGATGFEFAFLLCYFYHFEGHTVLDRVTRVEIVDFGKYRAREVLCDFV